MFETVVPIYVEHWRGGIIGNFTSILSYFEHWGGMKSSEDQKKSPNIIQRSDADHCQIIEG